MGRMVKRLSNLEIDEVSLVDRPANQHGLVAIAKSYQEDNMAVFDGEGNEVLEEELEHGDTVYDDQGNEFVFVEDGADEGGEDEGFEDEVGKAFRVPAKVRAAGRLGRMKARGEASWARERTAATGREAGERIGRRAQSLRTAADMQYRAIPAGGRAGIRYGGAAGGGAAGATYVNHKVGKSMGDQVLEELSKALNDSDRDQVFAKAFEQFEGIAKRNEDLEEQVAFLMEERDQEGFSELAKSYELPVDPDEIGGLMYRAAQSLPEADVAALDRLFSSYGEISKAAMSEIGYSGTMESDVLGQVFAIAGEAIAKSDSDMTQEQAVTALFSANPAAYDEYEAEQNRR